MTELLAFWWASFLVGILATTLSVIIMATTYRRIKHARKFVLYGPAPRQIATQAAIGFLTELFVWSVPYWFRSVAFAVTAVRVGQARPRWCQLLDVFAVGFRGIFVMLLYVPKDFVLVGAYRMI